jgi:hypothetical protein
MHYNMHLYALKKKNYHIVHEIKRIHRMKCIFKLRNKTL